MEKRLVFFIYVNAEYEQSMIYDVHFYLLKHFKECFDKYTFWVSLKDFSSDNLEFASEIIRRLMNDGFNKNTEYKIYENDSFREAKCFNDEVVSKIYGFDDELIFFGHTKGLSNEFNDSLLFWICYMYYFGLNFKEDFDSAFNDKSKHIVFYGFPLMDYSGWGLVKNEYIYAGTLFWINIKAARKVKDHYGLEFTKIENRAYAENFPGDNFDSSFCGTYRNKRMPCWELYHFSRDGINQAFNAEGDSSDVANFCEFYYKMINDLNIVL